MTWLIGPYWEPKVDIQVRGREEQYPIGSIGSRLGGLSHNIGIWIKLKGIRIAKKRCDSLGWKREFLGAEWVLPDVA